MVSCRRLMARCVLGIRFGSINRFQVSLPLITRAFPFRSLRLRFEELKRSLVDLKIFLDDV